jgi:hypothetical protein
MLWLWTARRTWYLTRSKATLGGVALTNVYTNSNSGTRVAAFWKPNAEGTTIWAV